MKAPCFSETPESNTIYIRKMPASIIDSELWDKPTFIIRGPTHCWCRSQWPRGIRRRSTAARPLRLWFRITPGAWMFFCCWCSVLSGRGLCDGLITRPEESYRLWRVDLCDLETSWMRRLKPVTGLWKIQPKGL
jgi:hypothetical protein